MPKSKMRIEFEEWLVDHVPGWEEEPDVLKLDSDFLKDGWAENEDGTPYENTCVDLAWDAWQCFYPGVDNEA